MLPRPPTVEDAFDDDTELPLPSRALPNTGARGALLEEVGSADEMEIPTEPTQKPSTRSKPESRPTISKQSPEFERMKNWQVIYPIYIDAKKPFKTGARRIAFEKAVWWPLSRDIAQAAVALGYEVAHDPQASHPRDWDNPGRVRVLFKKDGKPQQPRIKTKKRLLEAIAAVLHTTQPDLVPRPEQMAPYSAETAESSQQASTSKVATKKRRNRARPQPPQPWPEIKKRLPEVSPTFESGLLIDAVKAGLDAMKQQQVEAQQAAGPSGVGKGKRKVVRVRG